MKPVLFLLNISLEGPAAMLPYLKERNIPFEIRDLYNNDPLPEKQDEYGALVVMGGPMNVDEEEKFLFLKPEKEFIRKCFQSGIPILGLCLGGQLLARSMGASVNKNPKPEIGWMDVELTDDGKASLLFQGLPSPLPVFQWHGDTFEIPVGAKHLAYSPDCVNQAFSIQEKAFGLQFHMEVDDEDVKSWSEAYIEDTIPEYKAIVQEFIDNSSKEKNASAQAQTVSAQAMKLFKNFFGIICGYSL